MLKNMTIDWVEDLAFRLTSNGHSLDTDDRLAIEEAIRGAVLQERDACAATCKSWTFTTVGHQYADGCAERILARGNKISVV